jgi:hypothetical protein
MLGERMKLERVTVRGRREDDHWGTKGYKYPQIHNSNSHISKFGTSEKTSELPNSETSADCSPYSLNL